MKKRHRHKITRKKRSHSNIISRGEGIAGGAKERKRPNEGFNDWGGRGYDHFIPREV